MLQTRSELNERDWICDIFQPSLQISSIKTAWSWLKFKEFEVNLSWIALKSIYVLRILLKWPLKPRSQMKKSNVGLKASPKPIKEKKEKNNSHCAYLPCCLATWLAHNGPDTRIWSRLIELSVRL